MLGQMLSCVKSGVDGSIEKGGGEFDNLALLLKSCKVRHSVVSDQLLDEGQRWGLQRDDCNHAVSLMRDRVSRMWPEIEDPMALAVISGKILEKIFPASPVPSKLLFAGSSFWVPLLF